MHIQSECGEDTFTAMGDVDTIEYDQEIVVDDTGYEDAEQIEYTGDNITQVKGTTLANMLFGANTRQGKMVIMKSKS